MFPEMKVIIIFSTTHLDNPSILFSILNWLSYFRLDGAAHHDLSLSQTNLNVYFFCKFYKHGSPSDRTKIEGTHYTR